MLIRAAYFLHYLIWRQPDHLINGMAWLCLAGVLTSAGTSLLLKRLPKTRIVSREGLSLATTLLLFCLFDWVLLRALPLLKLSFSNAITLPLIASVVVRLCIFWGLTGAVLLTQWQKRGRAKQTNSRLLGFWHTHRHEIKIHAKFNVILFLAINLGFSLIQLDAYVVEPLLVETTVLTMAFDSLSPDAPPVRIVHVTDTHIERNSYREASTIAKINGLKPDIIVFTGDYLNTSYATDPTAADHFRQFVGQLKAPYGIFAVRGSIENTPHDMSWLVQGSDITWLENETHTVNVRGQLVTLIGIACSHDQVQDSARLDRTMRDVPAGTFKLLLYHSPDLIHAAAKHQIDLYLGGHTHGGQLRLPFYGAIVTSSVYGKRYEAGLARQENTQMYISRGLGFEGGGMPRARFLCRPEIVSVELQGATLQAP
ncbi:MAG: metallophosphoesterase family protein [Anaerolineae bacterium]|nr:metallophosphoesterase family protein [Anaerolineae bacterium]